jgi:RNase P subunit RPR2
MNWYRFAKSSLKLASPIGGLKCPNCGQLMIVDVNQRTGQTSSDSYGHDGQAYVQCLNCHKMLHFSWEEFMFNLCSIDGISIAPDDIRDQVETVEAVPAEEDEYNEVVNSVSVKPIVGV